MGGFSLSPSSSNVSFGSRLFSLMSIFKLCSQRYSSLVSRVRRKLAAIAHGRRRNDKTTVDQTLIRGLAPDGPDGPFHERVLPRQARRRHHFLDAL